MFFKHGSKSRSVDTSADGRIRKFPESLVNPMYKPRTLRELKELFNHTGINPAPVPTRPGIPEIEGVDPMDTPPIPIGGDRFETIRIGQNLVNELRDKVNSYHANQNSQVVEPIVEPDKQAE